MNRLPLGTVSYIQSMLRNVANSRADVSDVIPDGIFGAQTKNSVESFQKAYGLYVTGEVDNDTWDKLVEISEKIAVEEEKNVPLFVLSETREPIRPGEHAAELYVIQAMITALSEKLSNIFSLFITGTYDEPTAEAVRRIQILSGITPNSLIDAEFVNSLTELYNAYVTQNRIESSRL